MLFYLAVNRLLISCVQLCALHTKHAILDSGIRWCGQPLEQILSAMCVSQLKCTLWRSLKIFSSARISVRTLQGPSVWFVSFRVLHPCLRLNHLQHGRRIQNPSILTNTSPCGPEVQRYQSPCSPGTLAQRADMGWLFATLGAEGIPTGANNVKTATMAVSEKTRADYT